MENNEQAVARVVDKLFQVFQELNAKAYGELFWPDGEFTNVFGMVAVGPEMVESFHAPLFADPRTEGMPSFVHCELKKLDTRVRMLRSDIGLADVKWRMTGAIAPNGQPWGERLGLINMVVTREGDTWNIAALHNMDLPVSASR